MLLANKNQGIVTRPFPWKYRNAPYIVKSIKTHPLIQPDKHEDKEVSFFNNKYHIFDNMHLPLHSVSARDFVDLIICIETERPSSIQQQNKRNQMMIS